MQNGGQIPTPFLKTAVYKTAFLCYSLNNLRIRNNPHLPRTGSMKETEKPTNEVRNRRLFYYPPKAGGGWVLCPSCSRAKLAPRPWCAKLKFQDKIVFLVALRYQTTNLNQCPDSKGWRGFCPRMVRLSRCKNRAKGVLASKGIGIV